MTPVENTSEGSPDAYTRARKLTEQALHEQAIDHPEAADLRLSTRVRLACPSESCAPMALRLAWPPLLARKSSTSPRRARPTPAILRSRQNPKILGRDDTEVV